MNSRSQSLSMATGSLLSVSFSEGIVLLEEEATNGGWRINLNNHSNFWNWAARSLFLFTNINDCRAIEFLHSTNWLGLLLTCLRSLAAFWRTRLLDMIFISTCYWKMKCFSLWKERSFLVSAPWWNPANVLSLQNKTEEKSFYSSNYTFFPSLITLRAAMTNCTDWVKPLNHGGRKTTVQKTVPLFHY